MASTNQRIRRENIPATLASWSTKYLPNARLTKAGLKAALAEHADKIEFQSASSFHRYGSYFTLREAVEVYGPVSIEVRTALTVLVIEVDADLTHRVR